MYDLASHTAHCLNRAAAIVWQACDGRTQIAEIARTLHTELGLPADEDLVWLTLQSLGNVGLLEQPSAVSRRHVLRKLAVTGAAASLLAPLIMTIRVPTARAAASSCQDKFKRLLSGECRD